LSSLPGSTRQSIFSQNDERAYRVNPICVRAMHDEVSQ
jgi:hypothetical protein